MVIEIVIFGMGYVGIPVAALLANIAEFSVIGIQLRSKRSGWKIDCLNQGKIPFKVKKPSLDELIQTVVFISLFPLLFLLLFLLFLLLIYNPFFNISNILASIWTANNELEGSLLILYSDLIFKRDIIDKLIQDENDFSIAISPTSLDTEAEKVLLKDNFVLEIGKEIPYDSNCFEYVGIAKFSPKGVQHLKETLEEMAHEEGFLDFYFTEIIQRLIYKGFAISTQTISPELWVDIDYPRDLHRAETEVLPLIIS